MLIKSPSSRWCRSSLSFFPESESLHGGKFCQSSSEISTEGSSSVIPTEVVISCALLEASVKPESDFSSVNILRVENFDAVAVCEA